MTNKDFFIASWQRDSKATAKAFRSLPTEANQLNHHHHPNFRSPWEIVNHIGPHGRELIQAFTEGRADLVNEGRFPLDSPTIYKSLEDAAKDVEASAAKLVELAGKTSDTDWTNKKISVYWGQMMIFEQSLMDFCWTLLFDSVHHRGQLTSYYRILGVAQPSVMGPTYEEEMAMMAKAN